MKPNPQFGVEVHLNRMSIISITCEAVACESETTPPDPHLIVSIILFCSLSRSAVSMPMEAVELSGMLVAFMFVGCCTAGDLFASLDFLTYISS